MESDTQVWIFITVCRSPWCLLGRQKQIGGCLGRRSTTLIYHLDALILETFCRDDGDIYSPPWLFCEKDKEFSFFRGPEIGTLRKPFVKPSGVNSHQWTASLASMLYASFPFGKTMSSRLEEYMEPENVVLGIWLAEQNCLHTSSFIPSHGTPKMALLKIATPWKLSKYPPRVEEMDKEWYGTFT